MVQDPDRPNSLLILSAFVPLPARSDYGRRARAFAATIGFLTVCFLAPMFARADGAIQVSLGSSTVDLNGPWKFRVGDDPAWADPKFDDSEWETVDLTAPPGAHDDDVGLSGYVPGWSARGHSGYTGYAWYRLRVTVVAPAGESLALAGPPAVDSAYQVFANGRLLGSAGQFSGHAPTTFSIQPRVFGLDQSPALGSDSGNPTFLIAFRVWMGTRDLGDPTAGGIHIAPVLGETGAIRARYQIQWLETVRGYTVEVVEALAFILLAILALGVRAFDRASPVYLWLGAALVLTALFRANQAVFFWGQFESVHAFELISVVLLMPLYMAAWTVAWRAWFRLYDAGWFRPAVAATFAVYVGAQFLSRSWFHGVFPLWFNSAANFGVTWSRLVFLGLTAQILYRAVRKGREAWLAIAALVLVSVGLFAQELSSLGVKGIWFPFGTGVSRTQYAYAVFDVAFFALLWRRLQHLAESHRTLATHALTQITRSPVAVDLASSGSGSPVTHP